MATRQDLMRREIRDAAARLFLDRGISSVTLNDVASAVGISKGAVYHYFDTKDDLIKFVFGDWAEQSFVPFKAIADSGADPETKLRRFIELRINQMVSDTNLFVLSMEEERRLPKAIRDKFRRAKRVADHLVQETIREGQQQGVFADIEPHLVEFALMGMCNWLWKWHDASGPASPEDIAEAFIRILFRGILVSAPRTRGGNDDAIARHIAQIRKHSDAVTAVLGS